MIKDGTSKSFKLNVDDLLVILKNGSMVGIAALLTFVAQNIVHLDFGPSTAAIIPIVTVILTGLTRFFTDYSKKKGPQV